MRLLRSENAYYATEPCPFSSPLNIFCESILMLYVVQIVVYVITATPNEGRYWKYSTIMGVFLEARTSYINLSLSGRASKGVMSLVAVCVTV